jgi:hypothetical protein
MPFSATETNAVAVQSQVADGIANPTYKWLSLQDNILDGTYHPMDGSFVSEVGWWGTTLSDGSGNIINNPTVTITLVCAVRTIIVTGDSLLNEYPVDFVVTLLNGTTTLYTKTVIGNTLVNYSFSIGTRYDVTSITLSITKINKAARSVKILEVLSMSDSLSSTDALLLKTVEVTTPVTVSLYSIDTLLPSRDVELDIITASLFTTDTLKVKVSDSSLLTNIHSVMDASERQVFARVIITYTSPFLDADIITQWHSKQLTVFQYQYTNGHR